jgi:hypothetical protein
MAGPTIARSHTIGLLDPTETLCIEQHGSEQAWLYLSEAKVHEAAPDIVGGHLLLASREPAHDEKDARPPCRGGRTEGGEVERSEVDVVLGGGLGHI